MSATSMHKPGWRSRRRSRLSLVERAVPRLGRISPPDDDIKPEKTEEAEDLASTSAPPVDASIGRPGMPEVQSNSGGWAVSRRNLPDDGTNAASTPPTTEVDGVPFARDEQATPADAAVSNDRSAGREGLDRTGGDASRAPAVDIMNDGIGMMPGLQIDWEPLIDGGFIDPRDRSQPLSESMNDIIRVLIRQALSDQSSWRDRVILVTSPHERVSKTTAAINFAFGLTAVGDHHAVLVDVDTSGTGAVDRLGGGGETGIAAALADDSIAIDDVVITTDLERLTLVSSGAPDDGTLDRFASRRMLQILRYLTREPKTLLVIDAPPILASQEAAVLSVIAGQVVLAVEAGRTTADQIEHALQRIGDRHNVSIALVENSGISDKDAPSPASGKADAEAEASTKARGIKRRTPRTAVAAGAVAWGLFALQPAGQVDRKPPSFLADSLVSASNPAFSGAVRMLPERLSIETGMSVPLFQPDRH